MLLYNTSESTLWIVGSFLLITLIIGLYSGRGIKDIKDYALGNKKFTSFTMVLTMLATWIGGESIIGSTSEIFSKGIILSFSWLAAGLQLFLIGAFLSKKLTAFKNIFTIGDLMEIFYGKPIKIFAGILISLRGIFIISVQLLMLGRVFENFFSINSYWGIILGGLILSIYSIVGGIKSVTKTDVFQFIILIIAIPLLLTLLLYKIGGYKTLFIQLPSSKLFQISDNNLYHSLSYIIILSLFFTSLTSPAMMQRNFMTNDAKKLRNQYFTLSVLVIVMGIIFTLIGLSMAVLYPDINPKVVIFHAINDLNLSNIIKGIIISGFLAIIMSTADSHLHSYSLCVYKDILDPFFKFKKNKLIVIKLTTILIALLTILTTLFFINTPYFRNIHFFAALIVLPILHFPLIAGILGLKTDVKSFIVSSISAILTLYFTYSVFINFKVVPILLSILSNMIVYMTSHILQNKGIAWVKRAENKNDETKLWIPSPQKIFDSIINSIPTPRKIYEYSRFQVMKNGSQNIIFGIYCCINFTLPYFLWDHQDPEKFNMMTNLRFIGGIMAGLLIVKDQWKEFLKPYYSLYWHATLTYCLPFITTVMFLMTGGSLSWLMNVGTSIFFLIMLVTGEVFLILAPLGLGLGIIFYSYFIGPINLSLLGFDINYFLFYQVFFSTLIGLLFAYRKRISYLKQGNIGLNLGESLCHELRNTLYSLSCNQFNRARMEQILDQGTKQIEGKDSYVIPENLFKSFFEQTNEAINFDENTIKVISTFEKLFRDYKTSLASPKVYSMKS
ncbi:MAG: sodium:solute symporter family protein, partial [Bacteroidetes bacterium]|nr:sodium:solute symporter family protein [Bacteroidota bacterium]